MANNRSVVSWIVLAVLLLVGLAVGRSIWSSFQDTKAKLEAQKREMEQVKKDNVRLAALRDSLHLENKKLAAQEAQLLEDKKTLNEELARLRIQHHNDLARINKLWEADSIIAELDAAFPEWKGKFWQAKTPNGLEGMIAPRFFSAQVLEIMADNKGNQAELGNCNRRVTNTDSLYSVSKKRNANLQVEVDSLATTYNTLFGKYQTLNDKYNKEVKSHWFKFTPSNAITLGAGLGVGYLIWNK